MNMLSDYNHYINLKLTHATDEVKLIPRTDMEDLILMHNLCDTCVSKNRTNWTPDVDIPLGMTMTTKALDITSGFRFYDTVVQGHYWMLNACLSSTMRACATNLIVYAIQVA